MLPLETKVLLKLLSDAVLGAESKQEIYELIAKLLSEDGVILEPYGRAMDNKVKKTPARYNTVKKENVKEVTWPYFPNEIIRF